MLTLDGRRRFLTAIFIAGIVLIVSVAPVLASHDVTPARVSGEDRIDTAAKLSDLTGPTPVALLARADDFPDALAAAGLSGGTNGPVLLTHTEHLPDRTREQLERLGVERVYLLGGTDAISTAVEDDLRARYEVVRLAGSTRYGTAAEIAREVARVGGIGKISGLRTAFVASGANFPDALAVGSLAVHPVDPFPILLVDPHSYPSSTEAVIHELGIEQAIIVGGTAAVSEHVQRHLEDDTRSVLRLAGSSRLHTAVAVADFAMQEFRYRGQLTILARSGDFPDSLAAGLHAGRNDAPILLTAGSDQLGEPTWTWLNDMCPNVAAVRAVGGTAALTTEVLNEAEMAAEDCHGRHGPVETFEVEPSRRTGAPGASFGFSTRERHDERPLVAPLDVALFPCEAVDLEHPLTFADNDGDGFADGIRRSSQGNAAFESASGAQRVDPGYVQNARAVHGAVSFRVRSDGPDCAVAVVFDDADGDERLPVTVQGHPLEHVGVAQAVWQ